MKRISVLVLVLMLSICAFSQSKLKVFYGRVDSVLREKYVRVTYDTQYISRPEKRLLLRVRGNLSGNSFRYKNVQDENDTHAHLSTSVRGTVSLGASYMGISAALSINPGKLSGRNKDYELNISASSNRYILDFSYQRSNTLSGDINTLEGTNYIDKEFVKLNQISFTGIYIFNRRHFSYPAAFSQSFIQKRSAGSWLAGCTFMGGNISTTDGAPEGFPDLSLKVRNVGIGGGYGYNLVYRKWLFHLSAMPTIIVYNYSKLRLNDDVRHAYTHFPDMIINGRAAIIYNFSSRYFVGTTLVVNTSALGNFDHYTWHNKWNGRAFFGFRL